VGFKRNGVCAAALLLNVLVLVLLLLTCWLMVLSLLFGTF
jgi:hypothetical protein